MDEDEWKGGGWGGVGEWRWNLLLKHMSMMVGGWMGEEVDDGEEHLLPQ